MPRIELNEKIIPRLKGRSADDPSQEPLTWYDIKMPGFGVAVSTKTGLRSFIVEREVNGSKRRKTIGHYGGKLSFKEAKAEAKDLIYRMDRGWDPRERKRSGEATLQSALEAYLAGRDIADKTKHTYRAGVARHLSDWIDKPLSAITGEMVVERYMELSGPTATATMTTLGLVYRNAARRDPKLPPDPTQWLHRKWKKSLRRTGHVKADDMPKFFAAVKKLENHTERDFLMLLLFTGLRRSEGETLTWKDVDFAGGVIRIPAERTKPRRQLDLPMTNFVHRLLKDRLALGKFEYVFPSNMSPTGHITTGAKRSLKLIAKSTGVAVTHHDLRRTYCTAAENTDMSVMALQALVNHSPGKGVTAGYVQMTTARLRGPAQRVADLLKKWARIR
jgi:integrase